VFIVADACGVIALLLAGWWSGASFVALPALLAIGTWLRGLWLLLGMAKGVRAIVITSPSPHWQQYIDQKWAPRLAPVAKIVSWKSRGGSLEHRLWRHFTHLPTYPGVLVLRGLRHPTVYPFYLAFEALKHGDGDPLAAMEQELSEELGIDLVTGP